MQKNKFRESDGNLNDILAMLDTGSNKRAAKQLRLSGPQAHLTMNLAGGQKEAEVSEMIEIKVKSPADEDILKNLQVHTVRKPHSNAKNVSRKSIESYPRLKSVAETLHLSGGTVDQFISTSLLTSTQPATILKRACC